MLEKLTLEDFQCHEHLEIDFDERVTTIVGDNDSGKSAVVRALRWVAFARPAGPSVVRRGGGGDCRVRLRADGQTVTRTRQRSGGRTTYRLADRGFAAVGQQVPPDVGRQVNVGGVNFQRQADSHFWLALSGPEAARQLNAVVDLQQIDLALAEGARSLRDARAEYRFARERQKAAKAEFDRLQWVPEALESLQSLSTLITKADEAGATASELEKMMSDAAQAAEAVKSANRAVLDAATAVNAIAEAKEVAAEADGLEGMLEEVNKWLEEEEQNLKAAGRLAEKLNAVKTCPLCRRPMSSPSA